MATALPVSPREDGAPHHHKRQHHDPDATSAASSGSSAAAATAASARIVVPQVLMVLLGSALALSWRWQGTVIVDEAAHRKLSDPVAQSLVPLLLFPVYEVTRWWICGRQKMPSPPDAEEGATPRTGPTADFGWLAAAPLGTLHIFSLLVIPIVAKFVPATISEVLRSTTLPFAVLISFVLLGRRYAAPRVAAIGVIVAGTLTVAFGSPRHHDPANRTSPAILLIFFVNCFVTALRGVLEERVMLVYNATSFDLVGKQGSIACLISATLVLLCLVAPASWGLPTVVTFVHDLSNSRDALLSTLAVGLLNPLYSVTALHVTKLTTALSMLVLTQAPTVTIGVVSGFVLRDEAFATWEFVGYGVIVAGIVCYRFAAVHGVSSVPPSTSSSVAGERDVVLLRPG